MPINKNNIGFVIRLILALLIIAIPLFSTVAEAADWSDNFDSYTSGTFPTPNWIPDGNAGDSSTNYIDSSKAFSGKSLRLYGAVGGCWGALTYRPLTVSPPYTVEVKINTGIEQLSGCHPTYAYLRLRKGTSWANPNRNLVYFTNDKRIKTGSGNILTTFSPDTWYTVKVKYEMISATKVRLSYWINGVEKGSEDLDSISDESSLTNLELSADEGNAWFDDVKITALSSTPTTPTLTPKITQALILTSTQQAIPILEKADNYKVLLDGETRSLDSASLSRGTYYVVSYSNLLPYASGIEVLSSDGKKITSESEVEPVFTSIAWKEASGQLKPSDIQTLRDIFQTSKDIDSSVSPVIGVTSTTVSSINSLKSACISVPFVGKKCAWDAVSLAYPGVDTLASQLESLNNELNQWKNAASSIRQHLPNAISGIEQAKSGGEVDPQLQTEISQSLSAFETLQSKTNQMSQRLASTSSTLASAESGVRSAASTPIVGILISPVADAIGGLRSHVNSLKGKADSFSRSMGEQSAKLSAVTNAANKRTSELKNMWRARQSAGVKVYGTLIGIGVLILITVIIFVRKRKKGEASDDEKERKKW